jgi:DUF4097 and DUF4098 domain-containing protein YvlB
VEQKLTVNGRSSRVFAKDLAGETEIRSTYEPIAVTKARAVTIRGHHNEVEINETAGPCDVTNEYGIVRVSDLTGDLKIDGRNTEVVGRRLRAEVINIVTTYEKVYLAGFSGRVSVNVSHAPLVLEPETLTGPVDVQGDYADIRFVWPVGARHPFEAKTRQGVIRWGLAERPSVETSNGTAITKAFLGETSRPAIKIVTTYGDIRVEESPSISWRKSGPRGDR